MGNAIDNKYRNIGESWISKEDCTYAMSALENEKSNLNKERERLIDLAHKYQYDVHPYIVHAVQELKKARTYMEQAVEQFKANYNGTDAAEQKRQTLDNHRQDIEDTIGKTGLFQNGIYDRMKEVIEERQEIDSQITDVQNVYNKVKEYYHKKFEFKWF